MAITKETLEEQTVLILFKALKEDIEEIKSKPIMNGAFDKMTENIEDIKQKQTFLCVSHKETEKKVDAIDKSLHDPEIGIFKRLNDSIYKDTEQEKKIKELQRANIKSQEKIENQKIEIIKLKKNDEDLQNITGKRFEKLSTTIKVWKYSKQFLFFLGGGIMTFLISQYGSSIIKILFKQ
jgi:plasmid maintenance system killer protein